MEVASVENSQVDAQADAWFASYDEPVNEQPRRSRRNGGRRSERRKRAQQRRREMLMMMASFGLVGAMTVWFYAILTR
ncbi:MAG TPA: hypothetical protein VHM31_13165 [Polyangia bacterium]|nr:hypothetical protein [Polyangia bacterium]